MLTLDYGFRISGLRMIWLKVLEPNIAGIKTYEHAGFIETGRLPRAGYWYGQDCDEIIMAALPEDIPSIVLTHPNHRQILVT